MEGKARVFQFGPFELDIAQRELRRRGIRIRLSASRFRLLTLFVTRRGELLTREEIAASLWEDIQTVDVVSGINTAVNQLRNQLGDDSAAPLYIETVIGVGYRFVASVVEVEPISQAAPSEDLSPIAANTETSTSVRDSQTVEASTRRWLASRSYAVIFIVILAILIAKTVLHLFRVSPAVATVALPSALDKIYFQQTTFNDDDDVVTAEALSPDGAQVAYSDQSGITVRSLRDHSERYLSSPPSLHVERIAWNPAAFRLVVSGFTNTSSRRFQVWAISLHSDPARLLLDDAAQAAVSPDESRMVFTRKDDGEVWVSGVHGEDPHKVLAEDGDQSFPFVFWSADGRRILLERRTVQRLPAAPDTITGSAQPLEALQRQYRWTYESIDAGSGDLLASTEDLHFDSACALTDGRLIFLRNDSDGTHEKPRLLQAGVDPASGGLLEVPVIGQSLDGQQGSSLSASADGHQIAFVLRHNSSDIFVADFIPVGPVLERMSRLTHHSINNFPHAFTPDGSAVLFDGGNIGRYAIYRQGLEGSGMELIAQLDEIAAMPSFSPDGKWILFLGFAGWPPRADAIYRMPAKGGKPEQVPTHGVIEEFHCPVASSGTCVLREAEGQKEFVYYALDPVSGMGRELARTPWEPNILGEWSLSPDSSTVSIAHHDPAHPAIQLIRFVPGGPAKIADISVEGFGTLLGAGWAQNAQGLFVETRTQTGYQLLYVPLHGAIRLLRQSSISIWGVPYRDGRKLALPGVTVNTNLWMQGIAPPHWGAAK